MGNEYDIFISYSRKDPELVLDIASKFTEEDQVNPTGPETGIERVCRGGGWNRKMTAPEFLLRRRLANPSLL